MPEDGDVDRTIYVTATQRSMLGGNRKWHDIYEVFNTNDSKF